MKTKTVRDLKTGDSVIIHGNAVVITHRKLSRRYTGFVEVQYRPADADAADTHLIRSTDLRHGDELELTADAPKEN